MLPFINLSQKYVLSLDSLDLSLLSQYVDKPTDEKKLLWSKPFIDGESVYCEVKIPTEDLNDEDAYIEPSENYICHICNIDVPKQFLKQHNNSRLHQSFKSLTAKLFESVLKQINIEVDATEKYNSQDKFYCEICSKVVLVKHKHQHNRSKYHKKSIEDQKVLDNFMDIYVVKDEAKSKNVESKTKCDSESDTDWNFESESENEADTNDHQEIQTNVQLPESTEPMNKIALCSSSDQLDSRKEIKSFQLYLKEVIAKYKLKFNLPVVDDNHIIIVTPKGYKAKITVDAFHGYKKILNVGYCQICNYRYNGEEDKNRHSLSEEHVKKIIQPIDNNFARGAVPNQAWGHCLLCNTMIIGPNHAAVNPNHKKYKELTTNSPQEMVIPNKIAPKKTFCDVCKIHIDTHNFAAHVKAGKHKQKLKLLKIPSPVVAVDNTSSSQSAVKNKNEYCNVCEVKVPAGGMAVHEAGRPHRTRCEDNLESLLNECKTQLSKLTVVDNKLVYANDNIPSTSKVSPCTNTQPLNGVQKSTKEERLKEYKKQMAEYSSKEVECLVCKSKVPVLDNNIIEHVEGARHRKAVEFLLIDNNIIQKSFKCYYCELCKTNIDDFIDHIDNNVYHNVNVISKGTISKPHLREYVYDEPSNTETLALAYRALYLDLLAKNKIIRLNSLLMYCVVCSVNLSRTTEIDHMFGERHKSTLNSKV